MIESRYKIEYVLPDEDVKKASSFRALWYLLLIPLVLCLVALITYDFSINNITRDSLVLIEKAKVHVFNLEDNRQNKTLVNSKIINQKNQRIVPTASETILTANKEVETIHKIDEKLIGELTAKQELQLKAIQEQKEKNSLLNENLNNLSNKLVLEKLKNESLSSKLTEQEQDRLELELQLNQVLAESENKETKIEKLQLPDPEEKTTDLVMKSDKTEEVLEIEVKFNKVLAETESKEVAIEKLPETNKNRTIQAKSENTEIVKSVSLENSTSDINVDTQENIQTVSSIQITNSEESTKKSETDKIIEAMTEIKASAQSNEENKKIEASSVTKIAPENTIFADTDIEINNDVKNTSSNNNLANTSQEIVNKLPEKVIINEKTPLKVTEETTKVVSNENIKKESDIEQPSKTNSSVDDIIAAMESAKSNASDDSNQDEEIKQQVVEQGE